MALPSDQQDSTKLVGSSIRMVETSPNEILLHRIEDHQLDQLTNISRPLTLAAAGAAVGAFFSLLPSAVDATDKIGTAQFTEKGMAYCIIAAMALVFSISFGYSAIIGEVRAKDIVKEIRRREHRQI